MDLPMQLVNHKNVHEHTNDGSTETGRGNAVSTSPPVDLMDNGDDFSQVEDINPLDECLGKATHVHDDDDDESISNGSIIGFRNYATATVVAIPRGIFALPCLIADTGASHHMCHLQSAFYSFNPSPLPLNYVVVANERIFEVTGIGNIFCKVFDKIIFLHNVLCVPHLGHMIYSIPQHCLNNNCLVSHSTVGTYLLFPDFSIPLGDRSQARVRYLPDMPDRIDYSDRVTHLFEDSTASTVSLSDSSDSEETLVRTANHMPSSELLTSNFCIIDSGASTHMCPAKQAFISYTVTSHSYVTVANNIKAPCLGKGTAVFYLHNKFIKLDNVLHIPDLNKTPSSSRLLFYYRL